MINTCKLVAMFSYIVLSIHSMAASDVVNALSFSKELTKLGDDILGIKKMQDIIDEHGMFYAKKTSGSISLNEMAMSMSNRFIKVFAALSETAETILAYYRNGSVNQTIKKRCCEMKENETVYYFLYKRKVALILCYRNASDSDPRGQVPTSNNLLKTFQTNFGRNKDFIKWQYFGTEAGLTVEFPSETTSKCGTFDPRFRPWYVKATTRLPKDIVIIMDQSESFDNDDQIRIAKEAAKTVIGTLDTNDRFGVVIISEPIDTLSGCYAQELAFATPETKTNMERFIDSFTGAGYTNYLKPIEIAFQLLENSNPGTEKRYKAILFLTDGGAPEGNAVLEKIKLLNGNLNNEVVIMTYGIGNKIDQAAGDLLRNMAEQKLSDPGKGTIKRGTYSRITSSMSLKYHFSSYYKIFRTVTDDSTPIISVPYVDYSGLGIVISVSKPIYLNKKLLGVTAVDVRLADLVTEATYFNGGKYSYAFVIDRSGWTLVHPLLPMATVEMTDRASVDISALEPSNVVERVVSSMRRGEEGHVELNVTQVQSRGYPHLDGVNTILVKAMYYWKKVEGTDYSVCIVVTESSHFMKTDSKATSKHFVYHRLDLQQKMAVCSIRKQKVVTKEASVVKFTGAAFLDPSKYFNMEETQRIVERYEAYMTGKYVADLNFKDGVRQTVALSEDLDMVWKSQGGSFWRYVGFATGVIRMFPGPMFPTNYDHTTRRWYQRALAHHDVIVLTPPYVDVMGSGVVLSLCKALSRKSTLNNDSIIGVIAMDVKVTNIEKMLLKLFPCCGQEGTSCFLVDTSGFIVYHNDFVKSEKDRIGYVHIAEKEVDIANDLIGLDLMKPGSCLGINSKKTFNTWQIERTTKVDKLENSSLAYSLEVVPGTNVFLGVKKTATAASTECKTCPDPSTGEPRECQETDGEHCQCPCFTDAKFESCKNIFEKNSRNTQKPGKESVFKPYDLPCTPVEQNINYTNPMRNETSWAGLLPSCYKTECNLITIESECVSYWDCDWCQKKECGEVVQWCRTQGECPVEKSCKPVVDVITGIGLSAALFIVVVVITAICSVKKWNSSLMR